MSAAKQRFNNHALNSAQHLGQGAFRKPPAAPAIILPPRPSSLPVPAHPYPDNSLTIQGSGGFRIVLQRDGLRFNFTSAAVAKDNVYGLEQQTSSRGGGYIERLLSGEEALYALALFEDYIGPQELALIQGEMDNLRQNHPKVIWNDSPVEYKPQAKKYVFNRYGFVHEISSGIPADCRITYLDPEGAKPQSRGMRVEELQRARRAISAYFSIGQAVQRADFLKHLEEQQFAMVR